jgi:hypothetical protein
MLSPYNCGEQIDSTFSVFFYILEVNILEVDILKVNIFKSQHFESQHFESWYFESQHFESQHFESWHFESRHFGSRPWTIVIMKCFEIVKINQAASKWERIEMVA